MSLRTATTEEFLKQTVKARLEQACGKVLVTSADCQVVVDSIWNKMHERVSLNTIKRLTGFLPYENSHRRSTLDIIAVYLGYSSWLQLTTLLQTNNSDFSVNEETILAANLKPGDRVGLTYHPDRTLMLQYMGNGFFDVAGCKNSKLQVGDRVCISALTLNYPLLASQVIRGGISLGSYTAGKVGGVTSMILMRNEQNP